MRTITRAKIFDNARIPLVVMALCILSFGLLITFLGFYWDDWLLIFHAQTERSADLITLYSFDRPLSYWTAFLSIPLLGTSPVKWHLFALLVRLLTVLAMWWAMRALWPRQSKRLAWIAVVFAVYPAYFLQSISVSFSQHWIAYGLFFVSLGSMGWALRRPERSNTYFLVAMLTAALHMVTLEYFAGLELIRPLYLYILVTQTVDGQTQKFKKIFRVWWPYLLVWIVVVIWRLFFLELPIEPHAPQLLLDLRHNPMGALVSFVEVVLQGFVHVLWSVWQQLLSPGLFDLQNRFQMFSWAVGLLASGLMLFIGSRILNDEENPQGRQQMAKWSIVLGMGAIFAGLLPTWVIGKTALESGYGERFALPALFGAALFWVGMIWFFVEDVVKRRIIFALLLGIAVAGHVRAGNDFRWDWQQQQSYYEQMSLRAPGLETGTAIVALNRLSEFMPTSSTSAAINTLYSQSEDRARVDYWSFDLGLTANVEAIENGDVIESNYRGMQFNAESSDSLLFTYQPEAGCLWILSPLDVDNDYLPFEYRSLASYSNLSRIVADRKTSHAAEHIFGEKSSEGWCNFYQKAELARQMGNWQDVIDLMSEAEEREFSANYGVERLAQVEAHARLGNWDEAVQVSKEILAKHVRNSSMLCALWADISKDGELDDAGLRAVQNVEDLARCEAE